MAEHISSKEKDCAPTAGLSLSDNG